jgi:hypothetical protein
MSEVPRLYFVFGENVLAVSSKALQSWNVSSCKRDRRNIFKNNFPLLLYNIGKYV